jgi:Fe-S-cluster containining protein
MTEHVCLRCGSCCRSLSIVLCEKDYALWESLCRDDILAVADVLFARGDGGRSGDGFWRTGSGAPAPSQGTACPWLMYQPAFGHFVCRIHDAKPSACRDYSCMGLPPCMGANPP